MERLANKRGGDVVAINVGAADHEASILLAVPLLRNWFDSLASP
jgi:hypothetical protein